MSRPNNIRNAAKTWLQGFLISGPRSVNDIQEASKAVASWHTIKRAKVELGIKGHQRGKMWFWGERLNAVEAEVFETETRYVQPAITRDYILSFLDTRFKSLERFDKWPSFASLRQSADELYEESDKSYPPITDDEIRQVEANNPKPE